VGIFDALFGRSKPTQPNLDALFALPSAALTLEVALGYRPTGVGSVCYRAPEGAAFDDVQGEVQALLDADGGPKVERTVDEFGFTWLVVRHDPADISGLVTELHAVNRALEDAGFGAQLLCSLVSFQHSDGRRLALVYLYKRGNFYPFVPMSGTSERRDNALELQVRGTLASDLPIEKDLSRWMPIWGAPGL
jgi:hypothetical protein